MDKIIVTEEQAKVIEKHKRSDFCYSSVNLMWKVLDDIDFNLIDLARIAEGHPYEVQIAFNVGDIVKGVNTGRVKIVSDFSDDYHVSKKLCDESGKFKLVCKAEDRKDLK